MSSLANPGAATAASRLSPVIVLTGPTGIGKSHWALQLANDLPVEIVSVDSAQVYRGMDIGSAKPTAAERASIPHHLIDIRDPRDSYSAGDFVRDARCAIDAIHGRGRIPLLVGGTMLYLRGLYHGMALLPPASPSVRAELDAEAAKLGWTAMHAQLQSVDGLAAARIHPNDPQRIQRALEVYRLTGRSISSWQAETQGASTEYRWLRHALWPSDRGAHAMALADRFDAMLRLGLAEEVQQLHARGDLHADLPAIRSVGYRQLWEWAAGRSSLAEARERAIIATRQLAKRQMTWLRADSGLQAWVADAPEELEKLRKIILLQLEQS